MSVMFSQIPIAAILVYLPILVASHYQYDPTWVSLDARPIPDWYLDAKFGIMTSLGIYSVPAWSPVGSYAEWYWSDLSNPGSRTSAWHKATYGADFSYQDFVPMFKAELFNATEWADIVVKAGARYFVPLAKHHDGYCLWKCATSWNWNSVDIEPHIDFISQLMSAMRAVNVHPALYFSLFEWFHPLWLNDRAAYRDQIELPQLYDLINTFQPDYLFTDGEWLASSDFWHSPEFVAWLYNESPVRDRIVINDRYGNDTRGRHGGIYESEYSGAVFDHPWEQSSGIDVFSYGLNRNTRADQYLTTDYLIRLLVRTVTNGGNFLLNVGVRSDGTIPPIQEERLIQIGQWLRINGAGIYSTRTWRLHQEGEIDNTNIRYSRSQDNSTVYAFLLSIPTNLKITLPSPIPMNTSATVSLLGYTGLLKWAMSSEGVVVALPIDWAAPVYISTLQLTYFR